MSFDDSRFRMASIFGLFRGSREQARTILDIELFLDSCLNFHSSFATPFICHCCLFCHINKHEMIESITNIHCDSRAYFLMLKKLYFGALRNIFRYAAWVRFNRNFVAPVIPDQILEVSPHDIRDKTLIKPNFSRLINTAVVDGDWDKTVERVEEDIVFMSFARHFVDGAAWEDTPYVEFLKGNISEHGGKSEAEILERCDKLDQLYAYIRNNGFKSQQSLEDDSSILIESSKHRLIPPEFREISVNVARDGRLLWHGGFHRLCIAMLLDVKKIPVRIAIRHAEWQQIRDDIARNKREPAALHAHPDIRSILSNRQSTRKNHTK
jgi:hypothetical protein